jgi:cytochrome c2
MMKSFGRAGLLTLAASGLILALAPSLVQAGADDGKALYEQKCKVCNAIKGDGGKMAATGGPLDGIGGKHDAAWFKEYLANPKSKKPDSKMPKLPLNEQQITDLTAFLGTVK